MEEAHTRNALRYAVLIGLALSGAGIAWALMAI
jgi:hypothetical protein